MNVTKRPVTFQKFDVQYVGSFLQFGVDCQAYPNGFSTFSVALIEDQNGRVHAVALNDFQFTDVIKEKEHEQTRSKEFSRRRA